MMILVVLVGWTSSRPIMVDEHVSRLLVACDTELEGSLLAAQWVASRPGCQMPTSTTITDLLEV